MRRDQRQMRRAERRMRRTQRRLARIQYGRFFRFRRVLQVAAGVAIVMIVGAYLLARRRRRSDGDAAMLASVTSILGGMFRRNRAA